MTMIAVAMPDAAVWSRVPEWKRTELRRVDIALGYRWRCDVCPYYSRLFDTLEEMQADYEHHDADSIRHEILRRWLFAMLYGLPGQGLKHSRGLTG